MFEGEQSIPQQIRVNVKNVVDLLNYHGLKYEEKLLQKPSTYQFLYPKSKYHRYYLQQFHQHGPTSRQRREQILEQHEKDYVNIEGNLESISVGAMVEIIKNQLAENNREYYQPFENEFYEQKIELAHKNENISNKINEIIEKHSHLLKKKTPAKQKEKEKKDNKLDEIRKESGTHNDGSLGAYGGKKYQGLGARDEFDAFRRQKSQNYHSSLHQKSK